MSIQSKHLLRKPGSATFIGNFMGNFIGSFLGSRYFIGNFIWNFKGSFLWSQYFTGNFVWNGKFPMNLPMNLPMKFHRNLPMKFPMNNLSMSIFGGGLWNFGSQASGKWHFQAFRKWHFQAFGKSHFQAFGEMALSGFQKTFIIMDREAREIMYLVVSVCPSVRPSVCALTAEPFDLWPWYLA